MCAHREHVLVGSFDARNPFLVVNNETIASELTPALDTILHVDNFVSQMLSVNTSRFDGDLLSFPHSRCRNCDGLDDARLMPSSAKTRLSQ